MMRRAPGLPASPRVRYMLRVAGKGVLSVRSFAVGGPALREAAARRVRRELLRARHVALAVPHHLAPALGDCARGRRDFAGYLDPRARALRRVRPVVTFDRALAREKGFATP